MLNFYNFLLTISSTNHVIGGIFIDPINIAISREVKNCCFLKPLSLIARFLIHQ